MLKRRRVVRIVITAGTFSSAGLIMYNINQGEVSPHSGLIAD
jgi:hypothetical protein